jgi:hypothetical protein
VSEWEREIERERERENMYYKYYRRVSNFCVFEALKIVK